jgi:hypothetical protein
MHCQAKRNSVSKRPPRIPLLRCLFLLVSVRQTCYATVAANCCKHYPSDDHVRRTSPRSSTLLHILITLLCMHMKLQSCLRGFPLLWNSRRGLSLYPCLPPNPFLVATAARDFVPVCNVAVRIMPHGTSLTLYAIVFSKPTQHHETSYDWTSSASR